MSASRVGGSSGRRRVRRGDDEDAIGDRECRGRPTDAGLASLEAKIMLGLGLQKTRFLVEAREAYAFLALMATVRQCGSPDEETREVALRHLRMLATQEEDQP